MYDMYPDWGPTWRDSDAEQADEGSVALRQLSDPFADSRDSDDERPRPVRDTDARA
jgi:hypothetical protein